MRVRVATLPWFAESVPGHKLAMARSHRRWTVLGVAAAAFGAGCAGATEIRQSALPLVCDVAPLVESDGARCTTDDAGTTLGFRASQVTQLGTIETFATFSGQASNAFTPERLIASDTRRIGQSSRVMISGMKARLLDDRLTLTTQFGWSDFVDRSPPRAEIRDGSARRIRLDFKLVDSAALRWSVAGELSDVSDNFFIGQVFGESAQLALPGKRLALSSSLNWQRIRLTAAHDDYRSSFGAFTSSRFGISRNGISLSLKSGSGALGTSQTSLLSSRSDSRSVTLEFDLATLAPALAMDEGLPAALLPKYLMIGWRGGSSESLVNSTTERFARNGIELNGTWETPIGETSLAYWRTRRIGAIVALGRRDEEMVQLSHMVRKGDWRFGVDGMISHSSSTRGTGSSDRNVAWGGSIAYDVAGGPRLMLQLNDDRGRMATEDDSFLTTQRGQQISASLDLTEYLRKRFERNDLRLKIDYRKQLDRSTVAVSEYQQLIDRWTDGYSGEGVLVSFGMKL